MFGVEGGRVDFTDIPPTSATLPATHLLLQVSIILNCRTRITCSNGVKGTIWTADHSAVAVVVFFQNINQGGVFQKFYIGKLLDTTKMTKNP